MTKQRTRRFCVVAYYLALFTLFPMVKGWWEILAFLIFLFVSPATVAGTELLKALNDPEAEADERQRVVIGDMFKRAYIALAAVLLVPAFLLGFSDNLLGPLGSALDVYITGHLFDFSMLFLLVMTLPPAVMMWLEPDPVEDDIEVKQGTARTS